MRATIVLAGAALAVGAVGGRLLAGEAGSPKAGPSATATPVARILLVTGKDIPGHDWRQTAPVLAGIITQDARMSVTVLDDLAALGKTDLTPFSAVVLHFMNGKDAEPGPAARDMLSRFVAGGKGLVIVHFACGAFQDWPEYRNLCGRVYDPALRPHDPRGPFRVDIVSADHPITRGMAAFDADDELYTCLAGDRPIEVLATARSKVDGKDYPMAFVLEYGRGRVFHCPLGHDVKALGMPGVAELFRRGSAWAAGLPLEPARASAPN